jgi:magnesium-transporting ATPase (P-type)
MLERIIFQKNGIEGLLDIVEEDLYAYSCEGLRTLVMAERNISPEEYKQFIKIYKELSLASSVKREEKLNELYDTMEQKLRYIGCSAIEDKLQAGAAVTINKLMQADIRFFMLTGDKMETAIEIARSC